MSLEALLFEQEKAFWLLVEAGARWPAVRALRTQYTWHQTMIRL